MSTKLKDLKIPWFHTHKFVQDVNNPNTLFCECGQIKQIKCQHKWNTHAKQDITNASGRSQTVETWICEKCGINKYVNITTGHTELHD